MADTPNTPVPEPLPDDVQRARERAESLLPWAATGRLSAEDQAWLDGWLATTEATHPDIILPLRAELAWLKRTARDVHHNVTLPDPEQGLDTLLGRIAGDKAAARQAPDPQRTTGAVGLWSRLRAWADDHGPQLAGACAVLVVAQVTTLALRDRSGSELSPLGGGSEVVDVKGTVLLKVAFKPQATEDDIRGLLQTAHARIVDGPSALGLYLLRVKTEDLDAATQLLTARPLVVESVQRIE